MSDTKNKVNLSTYKKEMKDVLQRLVKTQLFLQSILFCMIII